MLWTLLMIILLAAIAGTLWWRRRQEQEWLRELTYLSRHEAGADAVSVAEGVKQPKVLRGAEPNLQNVRQSHKAAEEAKVVYDKTVAKLRALSPKHSRKLDATSGRRADEQADDGLEELPIFAAAPKDDHIAEVEDAPIRSLKPEPLPADSMPDAAPAAESAAETVADENAAGHEIPMFGAVVPENTNAKTAPLPRRQAIAPAPYLAYEESEYQPAKAVDSSLPVITLEEATRALSEVPLAELAAQDTAVVQAQQPVSKPTPDMEVVEISNWQFKPALEAEAPPKPLVEPKTITLNDPALVRTRERVLSEVQKLTHEAPRTEINQSVAAALERPQTIGVEDIRANLLRQRMARRRQVSAQAPVQTAQPNVIPEGEVFANLAKTDSPVNRQRIRRVNTAMRESVIPDAARVEQSHAIKLQPPKSVTPISTRFTPYAAAVAAGMPAPDAMIVEPPPVPEVEMQLVDIPEPPSFSNAYYDIDDIADRRPEVLLAEAAPANAHITDAPRWSITDRLISESAPLEADAVSDVVDAAVPWEVETAAPQAVAEAVSAFRPSETFAAAQAQGESHLPTVALLKPPQYDPSAAQTEDALLENSITIEEKLAEFKVKVKVMDAYAGPVITRYEIEPDVGVRGNAVLNLEKDLARSLGVASIRVVETIPGKTCMGLELPNPKRQMIRLSEIFNAPVFTDSKSRLTLALGQDITGQPVVTDLAKAPHLLVAGTTGSGKSVGVNAMILSMLFKATPEEVRMIMIDPKMLELSIYEGIPHLLAPVVTDMKLAANALNWCVNEMEKRYRLMSHMGVRNLAGFNQKVADAAARGEKLVNPFTLTPDDPEPLEKLPFIVVVVDEFADLMMTAGKKIEELIARLAQKARAAGIHLILATQRPSVDVITGLIKANIPTRIAFQVSSKVDSRTILDQMGAENLLGQGDMLFLPPGTGYPQRVHGAFASDDEVHGVVEYLKQFGEPDYIDDILTAGVGSDDMFSNANGGRNNDGEQDPMYDDAVACVLKTGKATISSVQRYLRIGYNRAARLIDQMEADGIVSAPESNGNRTILAQRSEHLD
ncbi:MAG: DNA translocase FtsK [Neisseria sp.]|nr:DNA translocase FtsK [Neisseria sp.]